VTQAIIEFGGDTIPIVAFSEHGKDIFDEDARTFERQLPATNFGVSDNESSEFFAFTRSHGVLRVFSMQPILAHRFGLGNSTDIHWE
jgi:hypothetical protein